MHKERAENSDVHRTRRRNGATLPSNPTVRSARSAPGPRATASRRPTTRTSGHMHPIGADSSVMRLVGSLAGFQTHRVASPPGRRRAGWAGLGMARRSAGSQLGKPRPRPRPVTQKNRPEPNVNVARYVTCPGGRLCLLPPAGPDSEPPVARVFGRWLALSGVGAGWCSRGRKRRSRPEARWRSTTSGLRLPRQRRFGGVPTPEANGVLNAPPVRAKWPVPSNSC